MTEREIFLSALEFDDLAARRAHVRSACADDLQLLARVESLLTVNDNPSQFLETPVVLQMAGGPAEDAFSTVLYENGSTEDQELPKTEFTPDRVAAMNEKRDDELSESFVGYLEPSDRPGSLGRLAHYDIQQVLGRGAFGIVLKSMDEKLHRVVAIKLLAPEIAATSPARKRFLREARASAAIRHEHVVDIHAVEETPLPYLVMEYVPGQTLQQRLDQKGPLDVATAVRFGRQIAEGLAAAHEQDLIHRDIKPGNILLEGGTIERIKITDFGLARAADDASVTQSGLIAGTPMYMAPEQAMGKKLDQRADLFSLGSVMYQMVSGRPPFRAANALAVLKRVTEDDPRPIQEIIPETPTWLCEIIARLHAKDPDSRYQSAKEVAEVLADCEEQLKAHAKPQDFSKIPGTKPVRSSGGWIWVAAVVLLLPILALATTEIAGVTHLLRKQALPIASVSPNVGQNVVLKSEPSVSASNDLGDDPELPAAFTNRIGMQFVIVPKGTSWLGGSKYRLGDKPVEIPADFYLGKYEVTQEEWEQVMGGNPSFFSRAGEGRDRVKVVSDPDLKRFPVECVSWDDCQVFVAKLNELEKSSQWVYRLPTSTEWQYACRGGPMLNKTESAFDFYFAEPTNSLYLQNANFGWGEGLARTCLVTDYEANRLGLFNMHGNVWEWSSDPEVNIDGTPLRVLVGGGWTKTPERCAAGFSDVCPASGHVFDVGLRLVRVSIAASSPEVKASPVAVAPLTDADSKRIAALPANKQVEQVRKELMQRNPQFDGMLDYIIENGVVTELRINPDHLTDISPIRVFDALRKLECYGTAHADGLRGSGQLADLTLVKGMKLDRLTTLNLGWTRVGDASLSLFQDCKDLNELYLPGTQVSDQGLAMFAQCRKLTHLHLSTTQVGDRGLAHFKGCQNLEFLVLDSTMTTDEGLANFKDCRNLTQLYLAATKVTDAGLAHFQGISKLIHLNLGATNVGDQGVSNFSNCKSLRLLWLQETTISNGGLAHFQDCKYLNLLWINGTRVTDLSLVKNLPLTEIHCDVRSQHDAEILRSMKTLQSINDKPAKEF